MPTTLTVPPILQDEFETVQAVWATEADTRALDSLILAWAKYEKQARRLLTFLVLQAVGLDPAERTSARNAIRDNRTLMAGPCLKGIAQFAGISVAEFVGARYAELFPIIDTIRQHRNKLLHGQLTGEKLTTEDLEAHVHTVLAWMFALAEAGLQRFGSSGLERDTEALGCTQPVLFQNRPFASLAAFPGWLRSLSNP